MTLRALALLSVMTGASAPPLAPKFRATLYLFQGDIDVVHGGNFSVSGTTKILASPTTPTSVKVCLHDQLSGLLVRSQWSKSNTGQYSFTNIRNGTFYVVAFDHLKNYRAVIADQLVPEAMP